MRMPHMPKAGMKKPHPLKNTKGSSVKPKAITRNVGRGLSMAAMLVKALKG